MRLRTQLILLFLVTAVLPLAAVLVYNRAVLKDELLSIRSADLHADAIHRAHHLDSLLSEYLRFALLLADQSGKTTVPAQVLESFVRSNPYSRSASIATTEGTVVASTGLSSLPPSVLRADAFRKPGISDTIDGPNGPSIYFSAPMSTGSPAKAVFLEMSAQGFFSPRSETAGIRDAGETTVICDEIGICLRHSQIENLQLRSLVRLSDDQAHSLVKIGRLKADRPIGTIESELVRHMMNAGTTPMFRFLSPDGKEYLGSAVKLQTKPWVVAQTLPLAIAMEPVIQLERNILLAGLLALALILAVGYIGTQDIVRPLEKITQAVSCIECGQWKTIEIHRSDEIGTLARAFNEMQHNLDRWHKNSLQTEKLATVGTLTAAVAHEIMNPLMVISGRLQLLALDGPLPRRVSDGLTIIERQVQRIKKIGENLLHFSRAKEPVHSQVDLLRVLEEARTLLEVEMKSKGVAFVGPLRSEGFVVEGDGDQLLQIFINLMKNAIDAITAGGTLKVEIRPNGDTVEVRFADTGIGIPPENLSRVFDPLFTTKPPGKGTGLGLPVVNDIVASHGGSIQVESEMGSGTTVIVRLPAHPVEVLANS